MTKLHCSLFAAALAALSLAAQAQLRNATEIDAYLEQTVATTEIPGIVALVVDGDEVLYSAAVGQRNVAENEPMSLDTLFNIASMTKPIAATAIMMLVEEGKLDLDDPISKYVPEFAGKPVIATFDMTDGSFTTRPAAREVLIRDLMSHSSGLAYGFANEKIARLTAGNPAADPAGLPLLYDPGTAWSYAGGIGIVAKVLEHITGVTLDAFLDERIFRPLGMTDTAYVVPRGKNGRVVTVHRMTEQGLVEAPVPDEVRSDVSGDGGLTSTAPDYAKFIRLFLNGGVAPDGTRLLKKRTIRLMGENQLGDVRVSRQDEPLPLLSRAFPLGAGRDGFGIGFQITGAHSDPAIRRPGSMSWAGIFNTQFWIDPESGIGAVLLMQYLPFYDDDAIAALEGFERRVYAGL